MVSIGANLGDRRAQLRVAVRLLREAFGEVRVSSVYQTSPIDAPGTPDFWNAVLLVSRVPHPLGLLDVAWQAEQACGRQRAERFGPRTLDVDVIAVGRLVSEWPTLRLPHPRAQLRAFVLAPWLELDPAAWLVRHGPVAELLSGLEHQQVRRLDISLDEA